MKKKIFSVLIAIVILIPCLMLTSCGKIKSLEGETLVYSKVSVTGSVSKSDYEDQYKNIKFVFTETEVYFYEGVTETDIYDYKFEDGRLFIKAQTDEEYPENAYAEVDGKYLVVGQTVDGGVVKIYFKTA